MNNLTTNLKKFAALTTIYSTIFFYALFAFHAHEIWSGIWIAAIIFGVTIFITGMWLGKRDIARKSRMNLDFVYHLVTFAVVNIVGLVATLLAQPKESSAFLYGVGFWGIGLLAHYLSDRNSLKGMNGKDVFK